MSTQPFAGGKNQKAPYSTTHLRVPQPIKEELEKLATTYKFAIKIGGDSVALDFKNQLRKFAGKYEIFTEEPHQETMLVTMDKYQELLMELDRAREIIKNLENERNLQEYHARDAVKILQPALKLKPNAGGAIKTAIRNALALLV